MDEVADTDEGIGPTAGHLRGQHRVLPQQQLLQVLGRHLPWLRPLVVVCHNGHNGRALLLGPAPASQRPRQP